MPDLPGPNGHVRWTHLEEAIGTLRREHREDIAALEERTLARCDRSHQTQAEQLVSMRADLDETTSLTREHQSFIDRIDGMTMAVRFLIGTNVAVILLGLFALFR